MKAVWMRVWWVRVGRVKVRRVRVKVRVRVRFKARVRVRVRVRLSVRVRVRVSVRVTDEGCVDADLVGATGEDPHLQRKGRYVTPSVQISFTIWHALCPH